MTIFYATYLKNEKTLAMNRAAFRFRFVISCVFGGSGISIHDSHPGETSVHAEGVWIIKKTSTFSSTYLSAFFVHFPLAPFAVALNLVCQFFCHNEGEFLLCFHKCVRRWIPYMQNLIWLQLCQLNFIIVFFFNPGHSLNYVLIRSMKSKVMEIGKHFQVSFRCILISVH